MARNNGHRIPDREAYRRRLEDFLNNPPSKIIQDAASIQLDNHFAKYACVLVSGYLETSIKELLFNYSQLKSEDRISRYIGKAWPQSMNMNSTNITDIVGKFDPVWETEIKDWLGSGVQSNRSVIDGIIKTRNNIAHGQESKTTGVSINSVSKQFSTAKGLVEKLEGLVR